MLIVVQMTSYASSHCSTRFTFRMCALLTAVNAVVDGSGGSSQELICIVLLWHHDLRSMIWSVGRSSMEAMSSAGITYSALVWR